MLCLHPLSCRHCVNVYIAAHNTVGSNSDKSIVVELISAMDLDKGKRCFISEYFTAQAKIVRKPPKCIGVIQQLN